MTAVHLLTYNNEAEIVSSLKQVYSSEGVPILNMASKIEFQWLSAQRYSPAKFKKQKLPIFDGLLSHRR